MAQQERIAEESFREQGEVLAAALNTKFAETIAAVQKQPDAAQGSRASQLQSLYQAQASTAAPLLPGSAESQPLNQTQLDQVRSLLSELLKKQPEQAPPPLPGHLRGKTKNPAADGSAVASMFGGRVSVDKTTSTGSLATTCRSRCGCKVSIWCSAAGDKFLASCGLRTATRAELEKRQLERCSPSGCLHFNQAVFEDHALPVSALAGMLKKREL